jgi:hypothetical protein
MFEEITEYIKKDQNERLSHIDLSENCIEIGGYDSREYRGLLAHYLKTTIPTKKKIYLCHKCHNHNCSNVKHMYWGTPKENVNDAIENGTHLSIYERTIKKYGKKEAKRMNKKASKKGGKAKKKSLNRLTQEKINFYRSCILKSDPEKYGWIKKASNLMEISHTQVKRFADSYCQDIDFYRRKSPKK